MTFSFQDVTLGEVCEIKQGRYLGPGDMEPEPNAENQVPVVGGNGILGYTNSTTFNFPVPLVTCRGSKCGLMQWADSPTWISNNAMAVYFKEGLGDNFYLHQYLLNLSFEDVTTGSAQPQITVTSLSQKGIRLPDVGTQKFISQVMKALQEKIQANNLISKTLEDIAQTIFKSWFIDFDPVKAKMAGEKPVGMDAATAALFPDSMEASELGLIPKGWNVSKLGQILECNKSMTKASKNTESLPYVPIDQIPAKSIFLRQSGPGSEARTSLVSFLKNDILFGAMRPYFHKVVLAPFDGTTRTTTLVLRPKNEAMLSFTLFSVFQDDFVSYATNNSQGTTIPYAVWNSSLEDYLVVTPAELIATAFNDAVLSLIEFGYKLIAENATLVEIRDSLLPRLISGELQIPEEMLTS